MDSIAAMPRTPAKTIPPEAVNFATALRLSGLSKAAVAETVGVTPGLVSQWANGTRPVASERAVQVASIIGADPVTISASYRETIRTSGRQPTASPPDEVAALRDEVEQLKLAAVLMAATMVRHRPAEAAEAATALRRNVPAQYRDSGLLRELAELLARAGK